MGQSGKKQEKFFWSQLSIMEKLRRRGRVSATEEVLVGDVTGSSVESSRVERCEEESMEEDTSMRSSQDEVCGVVMVDDDMEMWENETKMNILDEEFWRWMTEYETKYEIHADPVKLKKCISI